MSNPTPAAKPPPPAAAVKVPRPPSTSEEQNFNLTPPPLGPLREVNFGDFADDGTPAPAAVRITASPGSSALSKLGAAALRPRPAAPAATSPAERAAWFEQQAERLDEGPQRARLLLAASELWSLADDRDKAHSAASNSVIQGNHSARRHVRQLEAVAPSVQAASIQTALSEEASLSATPSLRAHLTTLAALTAERALAGTAGESASPAQLWHSLSEQAPEDVRAELYALGSALSGTSGTELPQPRHERLSQAVNTIAKFRDIAAHGAATEPGSAAEIAFVNAGQALTNNRRQAAAEALLVLAETDTLSVSAQQLAATLLAVNPATRELGRQKLGELLAQDPSEALRRAYTLCCIGLGDITAAIRCEFEQAGKPLGGALSHAARLALLTLFAPEHAALAPLLAAASSNPDFVAGAGSIATVVESLSASLVAGAERSDEETQIGRLLGGAAQAAEIADRLSQSKGLSAELREVLELEVAHQAGAYATVAKGLLRLPNAGDAALPHLLAALFLEKHDPETAASHYRQALRSATFGEAARLALQASGQAAPDSVRGVTKQGALREAPQSSKISMRPWLLLEAVLEQAGSSTSQLPSDSASSRSDFKESNSRLLGWLEYESQRYTSPAARAVLAVQQALARDSDLEASRNYLKDAWQASPLDLSLLALHEQLTSGGGQGSLAPHKERAAQLSSRGQARNLLLIEAALIYERDGQSEDATRIAAAATTELPLLQRCLLRNATGVQLHIAIERLKGQASAAHSPAQSAEIYLTLADLEAHSGDVAQRSFYLSQAVANNPNSLHALLEYEHLAFRAADGPGLVAVEFQLAQQSSAPIALAHSAMAARLEQIESGWTAASAVWNRLPMPAELPLWLARRLLPHAENPAQRVRILEGLLASAQSTPDRCTLNLRLAEATSQDNAQALSYLDQATGPIPNFLVAESARAELLAQLQQTTRAAEAFERVAKLSDVPGHRAAAYKTAAGYWRDGQDDERALDVLERAFRATPEDSETFTFLVTHYQTSHNKSKLLELIGLRSSALTDPTADLDLRLLESQVHVAHGDNDTARRVLDRALEQYPNDIRLLSQLATLVDLRANTESTEQTLLQLARLSPDPVVQASAYEKLAVLYEHALAQPARALRCFEEILRRRPSDFVAFEALIRLLLADNQVEQARNLVAAQEAHCETLDDQRVLALSTARLQMRGLQDFIGAEFSLREALKRWPRDPGLLSGIVELYTTIPDRAALAELALDLCKDVRACLPDEPGLDQALTALRLVTEHTADAVAPTLVNAFQKLLAGKVSLWPGAHARAMSRTLDDLLAPNPISSSLRTLLMQTHAILDRAFELDLQELEAVPLSNSRVQSCFETKARAVGVVCPQLYTISSSARACLITNNPSRVVLGADWVEQAPAAALDFMAWRSLKLIQARAGIIERLRGQQLLATMEAFLGCFVDERPSLSDPRLVEAMHRRLTMHLPTTLDDDLPVLALSIFSDLQSREQPLDDAVRRWANRSALLATGDLRSAIAAILFKQAETLGTGRDAVLRALRHSSEVNDLVASLFDPRFLEACRIARE